MLEPFTTAQTTDVGLTEAGLRTAAVRREHHGVYVESFLEPTLDLSLYAAQLVLPHDALGRVDLFWARWRIAIEYEGDQHRTDLRQWNIDIRRYEQLAADGCPVVRVTAERLHHPRAVIALVVATLKAAGWAGDDPVFDEEWHQLFPSAR